MRLAVTGPQNTGKSTFVQDLSAALPGFSVPTETYRDVIRKHNLSINQSTGLESQRLIRDFIVSQIQSAEGDTIFDRCVLDNYVYTWYAHTKGNIPDEFLEESKELLCKTASEIDLYLFIPSALSVSLVKDDLRDIDTAYVDTINRMFIETLFWLVRDCGVSVVTVGGAREERIDTVREALDRVKAGLN
jgi:nicotinamide riboside kinase